MGKTAKLLDDSKVVDTKKQSDTIRLWESYRDQALLWRAIALFQIPATVLSLILALILFASREVTFQVPAKPAPGIYAAEEIPDTEFVESATEFVNLIASYQPSIARRQFDVASQLVAEPMYTKFKTEMIDAELRAIESTTRTQLFFIDPVKTSIKRHEDATVDVTFVGDRLKIIAGKELPMMTSQYVITLKIFPRNKLNMYGIMVTNVNFKNIE